jgi:hypothetical protein
MRKRLFDRLQANEDFSVPVSQLGDAASLGVLSDLSLPLYLSGFGVQRKGVPEYLAGGRIRRVNRTTPIGEIDPIAIGKRRVGDRIVRLDGPSARLRLCDKSLSESAETRAMGRSRHR